MRLANYEYWLNAISPMFNIMESQFFLQKLNKQTSTTINQ